MKINKITLYKTSLDNSYINVIDGGKDIYLNSEKYKSMILDTAYSPLVVYNSKNVKCVYEDTGSCRITIANEYETIMDGGYNYACIENENGLTFYFITGMASHNDGSTPSMTIDLERDSWANNIEYFSNKKYDDKQLVIRSHFERIIDNGDNTFRSNYILSSDEGNFTQVEYAHPLNIGGSANVIWCGVRLSPDTIVDGNVINGLFYSLLTISTSLIPNVEIFSLEDIKTIISYVSGGDTLRSAISKVKQDATSIDDILDALEWKTIKDRKWFGCSPYESGAPAFYFPCAILTGLSDGIPNYNYKFTMSVAGYNLNYDFSSVDTVQEAFGFGAEEVLDAFLTLVPPFSYTATANHINITSLVGVSSQRLRNSSGTDYIYPVGNTEVASFAYITQCVQSSANTPLYYTYNSPLDNFSPSSAMGQKFFDPYASYNDVFRYDPRIYANPFTSVHFQMGLVSEEIPIQYDRTKIKAVISNGNKSEPNVSVFLNNNLIKAYQNIGCPGKLPTSYDKWKDFAMSQLISLGNSVMGTPTPTTSQMTRTYKKHTDPVSIQKRGTEKGARLKTVYDKSALDTSIIENVSRQTTSGGIGISAAGAVMNTVSEGMGIMSRATRPSVPSMFANNNIEMQVPYIIEKQFSSIKEVEDLLGEFYMYGYKHSSVKSVKENCRIWFDYCETSACSLPLIKNTYDRKQLEAAFDRGVTKWHYNEGFGINTNFSRDRNNVESKYVNAVDSQIYFDFTRTDGTAMRNRGTLGDVYTFQDSTFSTDENGIKTTSLSNFGTYAISPMPYANKSTWTVAVKLGDKNITNILGYAFKPAIIRMGANLNGSYSANFILYDNDNDKFYFMGVKSNLGWNDVKNKTLTVSMYNSGGSTTGSRMNVFLDGNIVINGAMFGADIAGGKYLNLLTNINGGYIKKLAVWKEDKGVKYVWTEEEAKTHLI